MTWDRITRRIAAGVIHEAGQACEYRPNAFPLVVLGVSVYKRNGGPVTVSDGSVIEPSLLSIINGVSIRSQTALVDKNESVSGFMNLAPADPFLTGTGGF